MNQNLDDHHGAAYHAAMEALKRLEGQKPNLVIVFSSIKYDQEKVLAGVGEVFADVPVVGGSAAGEINNWVTAFDAVNVMAIASDQIKFTTGHGAGVSQDSFKAAATAAEEVIKTNGGKKPDLFVILAEGITGNGAAIVEGAKSVLGKDFPIIGGSLGDDYLFKQTFQYYTDKVLTDSIVGVGFSGSFSYGFGIRHGWEPIGLPAKITKADGVSIKEIDGKPALEFYQAYFGKDASDLIKEPLARIAYTYPIGIEVLGSDELLIRDPVIANEKGEISTAAAIPEGTNIRMMVGDRQKAIEAAEWAAEHALKQLEGKQPRFIIMFNCMARNRLLGARCHEENQKVVNIIGTDVPMIGFYTYGEVGPLLGKKGAPAYFHNETMTLLVVGD